MTQTPWPSSSVGDEKPIPSPSHHDGSIAVDLRLRTKELQKIFEEIIAKHPIFHVLDEKYEQASRSALMVLEAAYDHHQTFSYIESVTKNGDSPEIFLITELQDSAMMEQASEIGVKECFARPLQPEEISAALDRCAARRGKSSQTNRKRTRGVVSFFGGRGGIGTTTIAVNFAISLCKSENTPSVVLLELNHHAGDVGLFLDLTIPRSLRELGQSDFPENPAVFNQFLVKHHSGLHVMSSGYTDIQSKQLPIEWIESIVRWLKTQFDFVLIDCGHTLATSTTTAFGLSSSIIVTSTLSMSVVRRTELVLDYLNRAGIPSDKIRWVLNRYVSGEDKILRETEQLFQCKTSWIIPNDYPKASQGLNSGQPLVLTSPKSAMGKNFRHMASSFLSNAETANTKNSKSSGWVNRIWSKVSKEQPTATPVGS